MAAQIVPYHLNVSTDPATIPPLRKIAHNASWYKTFKKSVTNLSLRPRLPTLISLLHLRIPSLLINQNSALQFTNILIEIAQLSTPQSSCGRPSLHDHWFNDNCKKLYINGNKTVCLLMPTFSSSRRVKPLLVVQFDKSEEIRGETSLIISPFRLHKKLSGIRYAEVSASAQGPHNLLVNENFFNRTFWIRLGFYFSDIFTQNQGVL